MILHIVLNESGTHAEVRAAASDATVPPGALVLRPAESAYGIAYETWAARRGETVELLDLQSRPWGSADAPAKKPAESMYPLKYRRRALAITAVPLAVVVASAAWVPISWGYGLFMLATMLVIEGINAYRQMRSAVNTILVLGAVMVGRRIFFDHHSGWSAWDAQLLGLTLFAAFAATLIIDSVVRARMSPRHQSA